jgi:hypothetical protein
MSTDGHNSLPRGIKRVELKVTVGGTQVADGLREFRLDKDDTDDVERREIFFCERPDVRVDPPMLALLARGILLRVRRNQDRSGESTLKLRGPEGCVDPDLWGRRTDAFGKDAKIEGDWVGDRHLVAASLDSPVEAGRIGEVVAERPHRVRRLLSDAQAKLAEKLLLGLGRLELLGPVDAFKWELTVEGLEEKVVAELWEVDERLRFLELSMRVEEDPGGAQRRLEGTVGGRGLKIDPEQETKTKIVLEHFAEAAARRR